MAEGFGTLQDKLDVKILLLYILRHLPQAVDGETLSGLALADHSIGYFDYAECLFDLQETGHVIKENGYYSITEKGRQNCETVESTLPYATRQYFEKLLQPLAQKLKRDSAIVAEHESSENGVQVHLSLSDGVSQVMDVRLLCGSEEQANRIEAAFEKSAEEKYTSIVEMLLKS